MSATLASILSIAAIAAAGTGTVMSFSEAAKARKKEEAAKAEVKNKLSEARKKLEINYMDVLSINKEPFERQREALISAGAQVIEAGIESERGGNATAGRVLAASNEAQGDVRDAQSDRLFDLEAAQAEEDSRLRDVGVQIDLGEVAGAQAEASEAANTAAMMTNQGVQGAVNTVGAIASAGAEFTKNAGARQAAIITRQGGGQNAVNASTTDISNATTGVPTEAQSKFSTTPQTGYNVGDTIPQVGVPGLPGYTPQTTATEASSDFGPQQNMWDGVDITPIMNNPSEQAFQAFMSKQSGRWAAKYRREVLGIQTKAGQAISNFTNAF
jgi:hypothetical protein